MTTTATQAEPRRPSQLAAAEIRAELARRQVSYRQLALMIDGVSYAWINRRISACDVEMTLEDVQRIADALGVPATNFLTAWVGGTPSPTRPVIGAYRGNCNTQRNDNVLDFPVTLKRLGDEPGERRLTRTAAA
jgi:hypothetical protein